MCGAPLLALQGSYLHAAPVANETTEADVFLRRYIHLEINNIIVDSIGGLQCTSVGSVRKLFTRRSRG